MLNVPTGHVLWTSYTAITSNGNAACTSQLSWFYSVPDNTNGTQDALDHSTLFINAAEEWKSGRVVTGEAAMGEYPIFTIVGGTNVRATFGMGIWA